MEEDSLIIFSSDRKPWFNNRDVVSKEKKKETKVKSKSEPNILYPLFKQLSNEINDGEWKRIFLNCSYGKFPRNFKYENGYLIYKFKTKIKKEYIISQDVQEIIKSIKNFIRANANIMSDMDKIEQINLLNEKLSCSYENEINNWSKIRSTKDKMIKISIYVDNYSKINGLTLNQSIQMEKEINKGLFLKCIKPEDIILENGVIKYIKNIYMKDDGEFYFDIFLTATKAKKAEPVETKIKDLKLEKRWMKFLLSFDKDNAKSSYFQDLNELSENMTPNDS